MKSVQTISLFEIDSHLYRIDNNDKDLKIGTYYYDLRTEGFHQIETIEDIRSLSFIAPELYYVLIPYC